MKSKGVLAAVVIVVVVALVLQIVSLATPSWLTFKTKFNGFDVDSKTGLWKTCTTALGGGQSQSASACVDLTNADSNLLAARALIIISILMVFGSLGTLGVSFTGQPNALKMLGIALGILFLQAVLQAGGTGAGMRALDTVKDTFSASYGFSMILGWVSTALYFCAAAITGIMRAQEASAKSW